MFHDYPASACLTSEGIPARRSRTERLRGGEILQVLSAYVDCTTMSYLKGFAAITSLNARSFFFESNAFNGLCHMLKSVFGHQYFQLIEPRDMHCQFSVRLPREYMKRTARPPCSATRIDLLERYSLPG